MTLTIAINLDNYVFIAGDHRLSIECEPFTGLPAKTIIDDYKKVSYWEHGGITVSGDVLLMHYFKQALVTYAKQNNWNFLEIAQVARLMYLQDGKPIHKATGTAFFSIFTMKKVELICLSIRENEIEYEVIPAMNAHFSVFAGSPDDPIYQIFVNSLKKFDKFTITQDFFIYHLELLKQFYRRQQSFDDSITKSFDLFIQDTRTGYGFMTTIIN
jgi:hypothetical protein